MILKASKIFFFAFVASVSFEVVNSAEVKQDQNKPGVAPASVQPRFFNPGGLFNPLFPGFNQGTPGGFAGNPGGIGFPDNSQFYPPAVPQDENPRVPPDQKYPVIDDAKQYPSHGSNPSQGNFGENPVNQYPDEQTPKYPTYGGSRPIGYPDQGFDGPKQPQYPDQGGFGGPRQPEYPNQGGFGSPKQPQYPDQGGFGGPKYPEYSNQGGFDGPKQPEYPNQGDFGGPRQPEYPNQGDFGGPKRPEYPNHEGFDGPKQPEYPNQGSFGGPKQPEYPNEGDFGGPKQPEYPKQGDFGGPKRPEYPNQGGLDVPKHPEYPSQGGFGGPKRPEYPNQGDFNSSPQNNDGTLNGILASQPATGEPSSSDPNQQDNGNTVAILGRPVFVPQPTSDPNQIVFPSNSTDGSSRQKQCVQDCETTSEYNPVCGSNNVTYFNPGRFACARNCGVNVFVRKEGRCVGATL